MDIESKISEANKKRQHRGFLNVEYDAPDQSTYKSINISNMVTGEKLSFNTGDFIIDYLMYKLYYESSLKSTLAGVGYSSSFDHFFMDGDGFEEQYVEFDEDDNGRFIDNNELYNTPMGSWDEKFSRYIISPEMKSFQDLIDHWKNWKSENKEFYDRWKKKVDLI